jgi:hypothetical protein
MEIGSKCRIAEFGVGDGIENELVPGLINETRRHSKHSSTTPSTTNEPLSQSLFDKLPAFIVEDRVTAPYTLGDVWREPISSDIALRLACESAPPCQE